MQLKYDSPRLTRIKKSHAPSILVFRVSGELNSLLLQFRNRCIELFPAHRIAKVPDALTIRLGQDGWRVLVRGRDRGRGEQVVASINAGGGAAEFLQADISALAEVRRLADAVQRTTKRLNLLINNAGIGSGGQHGSGRPAPTAMNCASR
jgi:hypothetical protein